MPRRILHYFRLLVAQMRPRAIRDRLKRIAHRLGLLTHYWRAREAWLRLRSALGGRRLRFTWRWWQQLRADRRRRRRQPGLTVAVDISPFWEPLTGIGWYLYRLLQHLAEMPDLHLRLYGPNLVDTPDLPPPVVEIPRGSAIEVVTYPVSAELSISYVEVAGWLRRRQQKLIASDANAVLFAPNYFLPAAFGLATGRLVATVHDLGFRKVPETLREITRRDLAAHLAQTLHRAVELLTDSETVRGELIEAELAPAERVHAVHLGPGSVAGTSPTEPPDGTPPRYVLHVGTVEPRKGLPTLLDAWRLLRARGADPPPLLLCGGWGWETEQLRQQIKRAEDEGWLQHLGYLPDGQVAALYRGAELVVMPSIYEGFGLPAVEAMSVGVALVVSDIPVLREVAGAAAVYAPPGSAEGWADILGGLFAKPEAIRALAQRSAERAASFDWRHTAAATLAVWRQAAERRTPGLHPVAGTK